MKQFYNLFLFAIFALTTTLSYAQNAAVYTNSTATTGTLGGVPFTIAISSSSNSYQSSWNLSTSEYSGAPLSNSQPGFTYNQPATDGDITITFDSPITNLKLYIVVWRNMEISFNHPFTVLSGNSNLQTPTNTQVTTTAYASGVLEFSGAITSLVFTRISGGNSGYQLFTFAEGTWLSNPDWNETANIISLFPNPSSNFIQLSGLTKTENYKMYNVLGAEVKQGEVFENEKINTSDLTKGVYFLKLENGNTIKFVKD
jgi:hypothetical protein